MTIVTKRINLGTAILIVLVLVSILSPVFVYAEEDPPEAELDCGIFGDLFSAACMAKIGREILSGVGALILTIFAWVLWVAGLLLNVVIDHTIVQMGSNIPDAGIDAAWQAMRDLANLFFIFILLYIAISTILGLESVNTRKMLVHVVIIALLLNFSLFFTKVIIDASNATTALFIGAMPAGVGADANLGLSAAFMRPLGLTSFYDIAGAKEILENVKLARNILLLALLGSTLFIIVAVVFFATAFMLIARFIIFIFLMVLSPLAFVAMALPRDEYSRRWWQTLFSQAIWAPALFALLWVSLTVLSGILTSPEAGITGWTKMVASGAAGQPVAGSVKLLLNFIIIIGLAVFSLIAAKQIGAIGGNRVIRTATGFGKYVGGNVASATARTAIRTAGLRKLYEKAGQTRLFQGQMPVRIPKFLGGETKVGKFVAKATGRMVGGIAESTMEATLGAGVKAKIGKMSVLESYKSIEDQKSRIKTISDLKVARKAEKQAIKDEEAHKITTEKKDEVIAERKRLEKVLEERLYTPKMQEAEKAKKDAKVKQEQKEEDLKKVLEQLAKATEKMAEAGKEKDESGGPGAGGTPKGSSPSTPTPSGSPKPHRVDRSVGGEGSYGVEPSTPPPSSPPTGPTASKTPPPPRPTPPSTPPKV